MAQVFKRVYGSRILMFTHNSLFLDHSCISLWYISASSGNFSSFLFIDDFTELIQRLHFTSILTFSGISRMEKQTTPLRLAHKSIKFDISFAEIKVQMSKVHKRQKGHKKWRNQNENKLFFSNIVKLRQWLYPGVENADTSPMLAKCPNITSLEEVMGIRRFDVQVYANWENWMSQVGPNHFDKLNEE